MNGKARNEKKSPAEEAVKHWRAERSKRLEQFTPAEWLVIQRWQEANRLVPRPVPSGFLAA